MCGIAGFLGSPDRPLLERMVAALTHRGPDDEGYWESPDVSLGMRRLAIIDVETGQQPVFNEDHKVAAVFNGEIFNFVELREHLQQKGHRFRSHHSDSEVIVHLYEQYGEDFLHHLNGMFAIALWDAPRRKLLIARDRAGIKPLYFARTAGGLAFGSEPKALLARPDISRDPDLSALHHYFSFKNIPAPMSAFAAIEQLRPGELACFRDGQLQRRRWWRMRFQEDADITEAEAAERIRELLSDSVRLQMRSDVPFGAYLSGGVDSSSVVALMSGMTDKPVQTFTLIYDDGYPAKDADRAYARDVSEMYGTDHHEQVVRYEDVPQYIDQIVESFDEPFSGVVSTFFITQLIEKHVKVALSGDGADELFGSYLPHRLAQPLALYERHRSLRTNMSPEEEAALGSYREDPDQLGAILDRGDAAARRMGQYIADEADKQTWYTGAMRTGINGANSEALIRDLLNQAGTQDPLNRTLFLDFETLLPDQVLPFVDRLSMAHSVEVRPPFLDHRLMEFVATLPGSFKIKNGRVKHILKEAVGGLLPDGIVDRPKEGFLMPINDWILNHLRPFVEELLSARRLAEHGLIRPEVIGRFVDDHYAGRANHGNRLWNLIMFQMWWNRYVN